MEEATDPRASLWGFVLARAPDPSAARASKAQGEFFVNIRKPPIDITEYAMYNAAKGGDIVTRELSPAVVGVIIAIVVVVVAFFLWRGATGGGGSKAPGEVGNPGPFSPGGPAMTHGGAASQANAARGKLRQPGAAAPGAGQ